MTPRGRPAKSECSSPLSKGQGTEQNLSGLCGKKCQNGVEMKIHDSVMKLCEKISQLILEGMLDFVPSYNFICIKLIKI